MKMPEITNRFVNKDGTATCITLFNLFGRRVELVYIPVGKAVTPHTHPNMDKELLFLCGEADFHRTSATESILLHVTTREHRGRKFTVKSYHKHWADNITKPLFFILFEKWNGEAKSEVTSYAV